MPLGNLPTSGGVPIESFVALGVLLIGSGSVLKLRDRRSQKDNVSQSRDKDS